MIACDLPGEEQQIIFTKEVIDLWMKHRQRKFFHTEGGGQLFAKIKPDVITVNVATSPHVLDFRSRFLFIPNKRRSKKKIKKFFDSGFHYVGEWHTHPENMPSPSIQDLSSMKECFIKSTHELNYFIMVIVGNTLVLENIWVGIFNKTMIIPLKVKMVNN